MKINNRSQLSAMSLLTMKHRILTLLGACAGALAFTAHASQSGTTHYFSGSYADFTSMPPAVPGFYVLNYFMYYNDAVFGGGKELPYGRHFLAAGVHAEAQAECPTLIYAYPLNLNGVQFSSGVSIPFVWLDVKADATFSSPRGQRSVSIEQSVSGGGDVQLMPIMAAWTNGDFSLGGNFNVYTPSGHYETGKLATEGLGYWTFEPMLGFSWISSTIGTEFSLFTAADFNSENTKADYQSGSIFHVDATLAQHVPLFGGFLGVGASAFYLKQFTGDSGSGAALGDFKMESYGVGPTASYVHQFGKSYVILNGSWLPQLHTENTTKGNFIWVKLTVTF